MYGMSQLSFYFAAQPPTMLGKAQYFCTWPSAAVPSTSGPLESRGMRATAPAAMGSS